MTGELAEAHSLVEANLFVVVTPCPACGRGPLSAAGPPAAPTSITPANLTLEARCAKCSSTKTFVFALPGRTGSRAIVRPTAINSEDSPSRIIDVAQWLTLAKMIGDAAAAETDRIQARHLLIDVGQCLNEALKFYDDEDNDLPPPGALFHDASRRRFRDHPEEFSRRRLLDARSRLPVATESEGAAAGCWGIARWFTEMTP